MIPPVKSPCTYIASESQGIYIMYNFSLVENTVTTLNLWYLW
jgi:hypothetical protein